MRKRNWKRTTTTEKIVTTIEPCLKCPLGWEYYKIGANEKCIFGSSLKLKHSRIDTFCQNLNATVPYPTSYKELSDYHYATKSIALSDMFSIALKSYHGIALLDYNTKCDKKCGAKWEPFPDETIRSVNVLCEREPNQCYTSSKCFNFVTRITLNLLFSRERVIYDGAGNLKIF